MKSEMNKKGNYNMNTNYDVIICGVRAGKTRPYKMVISAYNNLS